MDLFGLQLFIMWCRQFRDLFRKYNETDLAEAKAVLAKEVDKYRPTPYSKLAGWTKSTPVDDYSVTGNSGTEYQIEVMAVWDDKKKEDVRLMLSIDGGPISAVKPISDSFIKASDGSFVGE